MTVIAYKDNMVAADSAVSDETFIIGTVNKLKRTKFGVAGFAGQLRVGQKWFSYLDTLEELPKSGDPCPVYVEERDNSVLFLIKPDGLILEVSQDSFIEYFPKTEMQVWGSGGDTAFGAMAAGADPVKAVKVALQRMYGSCSTPVQWLEIVQDE